MTELINAQNKILGYLTRLNDMVIMSNSNGQFTLTKIAENLISEIFSELYQTKITNTNLKISNFPAIDLHSETSRLAIQVSSSDGADKVSHTLDTFLKNDLEKDYDRLIIVILANKKYDKTKLTNKLKPIYKALSKDFNFDTSNDLIDLSGLYGLICNQLDIDQTIEIASLMRRYFDEYVGQKQLTKYYDKLKEQFFQTVMDDQTGMTLNSIYVEPHFSILSQSANKSSELLSANREQQHSPKIDLNIHELLNKRFSGLTEHNQMFSHPDARVTIVMGYPGQGKTSMCNKLLFDILTSPFEKNVFYLKLRNITDTRSLIDNPFNVILSELETELDENFTKEMLKNSIVILDGLDELYMKDDLNAEHIETFVKGLITETSKYTQWEVLITTRHGYINFQKLFRENYIAVTLKPLNVGKQLEWNEKYRKFHPESWLDKEFLKGINSYNTYSYGKHFLSELVNQPLLLYIIASLEKPVDASANRTEIYNLLFDQIIDRKYSKDGQIENLKQLSREDLRFMLQEIAYLIFKSGKGYLTSDEVLKAEALEDILKKIGDSHLSNSLKGILISFYFKEVRDPASDQAAGIEFFHKSLQEYLTAEHITEDMFHTFLNKDQNKQYILKKGPHMLSYLNSILGEQEITSEIWDFISDLIKKKDFEAKLELAKRLVLHIDYFFEKDFISEVQIGDINTQTKIILTLNFYWRFLTSCNPLIDYMRSKPWVNKFFATHLAMQSLEINLYGPKGLSNQTIEDVQLSYLRIHGDILDNTKFLECYSSHITIAETTMTNVSFRNSQFSSLIINDSDGTISFQGCEFIHCTIYANEGNEIHFHKCHFTDRMALVSDNGVDFLFEDCSFTEYAVSDMKGSWGDYTFKNCVIERMEKNQNSDRYDTVHTMIADTKGGIRFFEDINQLRLFETE